MIEHTVTSTVVATTIGTVMATAWSVVRPSAVSVKLTQIMTRADISKCV